jgi:hypothetical protein
VDLLAIDILSYFSEKDIGKIRQHTVVGYRIPNMFDETLDNAEYFYGHHER